MTTKMVDLFEEDEEKKKSQFTTRGVQFHFHNPSEHTIDGEFMDMELHIVHKLMYVQKNQEFFFNKWKYAVNTIMFRIPDKMHLLSNHQKESMDFFDDFMKKVIEQRQVDEVDEHLNKFSRNKRHT
mmetsp:Transcript_1833/g.2467  ORF Transcript_1833/g.2467 Transcript_1833/m.2467 type:complete len:126 (+) Transcript_1833:391-768(+)